jgi:hypothetical protein
LPLYRSSRQWSDRVKSLDLPLFAGYVFCRFTVDGRTQVLDTPGVGRIVDSAARWRRSKTLKSRTFKDSWG